MKMFDVYVKNATYSKHKQISPIKNLTFTAAPQWFEDLDQRIFFKVSFYEPQNMGRSDNGRPDRLVFQLKKELIDCNGQFIKKYRHLDEIFDGYNKTLTRLYRDTAIKDCSIDPTSKGQVFGQEWQSDYYTYRSQISESIVIPPMRYNPTSLID
jgi:hypothetical protein